MIRIARAAVGNMVVMTVLVLAALRYVGPALLWIAEIVLRGLSQL